MKAIQSLRFDRLKSPAKIIARTTLVLTLPLILAFVAGGGHLTNELLSSTFFSTLLIGGVALWFYSRTEKKKAIGTNNYLARLSREAESGLMGKSIRLVTPILSLMAYSLALANGGYFSGIVVFVAFFAVVFIFCVSFDEETGKSEIDKG